MMVQRCSSYLAVGCLIFQLNSAPAADWPQWRHDGGRTAVTPESLPADERHAAYGLLQRLVAGEDDIELRRELSEIHPRLLGLFLARRG